MNLRFLVRTSFIGFKFVVPQQRVGIVIQRTKMGTRSQILAVVRWDAYPTSSEICNLPKTVLGEYALGNRKGN